MRSTKLEEHTKTLVFPCLMQVKADEINTGLVVFFYEWGRGMVVFSDDNHTHKLGSCLTFWKMADFEPYSGSILLSNVE